MKKIFVLTLVFLSFLVGCNRKNQPPQQMDGVESRGVDNITITWMRDNAEPRIMPRDLFSDAPDSIINKLGLQDGIPASVSTFLVQVDDKYLLFDTGLGLENSRLLKCLNYLGLTPDSIDYLYLTHFHADHIGGMLHNGEPVFTKAEVYASQPEFDYWINKCDQENKRQCETMEIYHNQLHLFQFGDTLPCNVIALDASGHTPGHTAFYCGNILIYGDLIHGSALQIPYPQYCANYDIDKPKAVESRKRLLHDAKYGLMLEAGMHLPEPAFRDFRD